MVMIIFIGIFLCTICHQVSTTYPAITLPILTFTTSHQLPIARGIKRITTMRRDDEQNNQGTLTLLCTGVSSKVLVQSQK